MTRQIVLVEDVPNDVELALYAIKKCGVFNDVIVAGDGKEALNDLPCRGKYLSREPGNPALVLLDLKLPPFDGRKVLNRICSFPTLAGVAVVNLTASAVKKDIKNTVALGIAE